MSRRKEINEEASTGGTDFERCIACPIHGRVILKIHEQKLQKSKTKSKMRCIFYLVMFLKAPNGIFLEKFSPEALRTRGIFLPRVMTESYSNVIHWKNNVVWLLGRNACFRSILWRRK